MAPIAKLPAKKQRSIRVDKWRFLFAHSVELLAEPPRFGKDTGSNSPDDRLRFFL